MARPIWRCRRRSHHGRTRRTWWTPPTSGRVVPSRHHRCADKTAAPAEWNRRASAEAPSTNQSPPMMRNSRPTINSNGNQHNFSPLIFAGVDHRTGNRSLHPQFPAQDRQLALFLHDVGGETAVLALKIHFLMRRPQNRRQSPCGSGSHFPPAPPSQPLPGRGVRIAIWPFLPRRALHALEMNLPANSDFCRGGSSN